MFLSQLALVSAALIAAQQPTAAGQPDSTPQGEITKEQADKLIDECDDRRFETSADVPRDNGKVRRTKITLCAAESDSDYEWVTKLEKAAEQVEAHPTFPAATKQKLVDDLRAEIARVKASLPSFNLALPMEPQEVLASTPNETAPVAPNLPPPRQTTRSPLADFNALPPLPRGPASAASTASAARAAGSASVAAAVPARRGPQLTVQCVIFGDHRAQRCGVIARDERLVIRATEAFDGPVSLRFTRSDSTTAEVPFATQRVRAGQTAQLSIPKAICRGRVRAEFRIEAVTPVINGGRSGENVGSFTTRCDMG